MIEETQPKRPNVNILRMAALIVVASLAGSFVGQYIERSRTPEPQTKLQTAIQEFQSGYDEAALNTLKPLADQGNPKAQYWLADIYENGLGVKKSIGTAVNLLEKSAGQGFVPAEARLGGLYLNGDETMQDFVKAQMWLRKAAAAGSSSAERQLGQIFELGLGVTRDPPSAYAWYEAAVLHGDDLAQHMRDELVARMSPSDQAEGEKRSRAIVSETKAPSH